MASGNGSIVVASGSDDQETQATSVACADSASAGGHASPAGAYVIKLFSVQRRVAKIAGLLAVPLLLIALVLATHGSSDHIATAEVMPLGLLAIALWYSRRIWRQDHVEVLDTIRYRVYPVNARKKVGLATVAMLLACVVVVWGQSDPSSPTYAYGFALLPLGLYAVYLAVLFFPQYAEMYTPAAKAEYARRKYVESLAEQERQERKTRRTWVDDLADELWRRWYVRYTVGGALLWVTVLLIQANGKYSTIFAVLAGIWGIVCVKEIALLAVGLCIAGVLVCAVFGVLAGIPVSAAIIIGALIIAGSRNR